MKKTLCILLNLLIVCSLFAQKGKVTSALGYKESGDLVRAYETIQIALDSTNEKAMKKTIPWPRTWEVKGEIMQEMFRTQNTDILPEPLFQAFDAYKLAIDLDTEAKFTKNLIVDLSLLQTDFSNYAIKNYEAEQYDKALRGFECYMEISNLDIINTSKVEVIDTAILYNAGLTAYKAGNWNKAILYFKKSAIYNYNGAASSFFAYKAYKELGDTINSLLFLKDSFEKYPDNEQIMVELINYYIDHEKRNEAISYLDMALQKQPENMTLYLAKASALEKLNREEDAIEVYEAAISKDQTQYLPYYSIGVIYYNRAIAIINDAAQLPATAVKEYEAEMSKGNSQLKEALPFLEKAYNLDSSEISVLESLRLIYYRLQSNDTEIQVKFKEVDEKLKQLKQKI